MSSLKELLQSYLGDQAPVFNTMSDTLQVVEEGLVERYLVKFIVSFFVRTFVVVI